MFEFDLENHKYQHVHFTGIGGISMSGLAEILLNSKYIVTGTDTKESHIIEHLRSLGAIIYIGHKKEYVSDADLLIYTDAVSQDNEELLFAKSSKIPIIDRASFLGAIMKNYADSIAVSGTHGKTTTTSMIATITNNSTLDPTILLGGELDDIGGNVRLGSKKYILTEACEYKANILKYFPTNAIILNIDKDHLDFFKDIDHIVDTFVSYGKNLKKDNFLIINKDDEHCDKVIQNTNANVITFGINCDCDYKAENIKFSKDGYSSFLLNIRGKKTFPVELNVMGHHNIYNALASIAASHNLGMSIEYIIKNLSLYKGVHRRLEFKGIINNAKIFDDYAHHPTEIKATLEAINNTTKSNVYCIFQPHTFSRTKILLDNFSKAFKLSHKVIITDIYAAREIDNGEIHSRDLAKVVKKSGTDAIYLSTFEEIKNYLLQNIKPNDIILTMGAGNVHLIGETLLEEQSKKLNTNKKAVV
jgi:UDP-N-acetylmuramate--alanine ligase